MEHFDTIYFQVAFRSYKSRIKGLPISYNRNIKPTIAKIKATINNEIPDLTYSGQYKPEKSGNVYIIRLDKSKVFVRVRSSQGKCEEDILITNYDKK